MAAPTIDVDQVRRIARLARLKLTAEEETLFAGQLGKILAYVEQLASINTDGVEPLAHPHAVLNVLREDVARPSFNAEQALANAPDRHDSYFRVPAIIDSGA